MPAQKHRRRFAHKRRHTRRSVQRPSIAGLELRDTGRRYLQRRRKILLLNALRLSNRADGLAKQRVDESRLSLN